jgi:hypothetical protein
LSSVLVRFSGLAAILGGVLGIVLTPILTYLYATNSDVYGYFGRAYFPVYLGCIVGLAALSALRRKNPELQTSDKPDEERLIVGITFFGLAVGMVGTVLDYWAGSPGEGFTQAQVTGYFIEILGLLFVLLGSTLLGLQYRRTNAVPALVAWLLIAAGPGGLLLSFLHIPSGAMLLFCCAWVVLGYLLLTGKVASAEQRVRVT